MNTPLNSADPTWGHLDFSGKLGLGEILAPPKIPDLVADQDGFIGSLFGWFVHGLFLTPSVGLMRILCGG